jgi:hypothetical protein
MTVRLSISTLSPRLAAHWKRAIPGSEIWTEPLEETLQREDFDVLYVPASVAQQLGGEPSTESHQYFHHSKSGRLMVIPRATTHPKTEATNHSEHTLIITLLEVLTDLCKGRGVTYLTIHDDLLSYDRSSKTKFFDNLARAVQEWRSTHPNCLQFDTG